MRLIGAGKGKSVSISNIGNEKRTAGTTLGVAGASPKPLMTADTENIQYYQNQVEPVLKMYGNDYSQEDVDELKDYMDYRISYWSHETPDELFNRLEKMGSKPYHKNKRPKESFSQDEKNELFRFARRWNHQYEKLRGGENDWKLPFDIKNEFGDYDETSIHSFLTEITSQDNTYQGYYDLFNNKSIFEDKSEDERKQYIWDNFYSRPSTPKEKYLIDKYGDIGYKEFKDRWNDERVDYDLRPELRKLMQGNPQFKNDYSIIVDSLGILQSVNNDIPKVSLGMELNTPSNEEHKDALAYMSMVKPEMTFMTKKFKSTEDPYGDEVSLSGKLYALSTNWTLGGRDIIDTTVHEYGHHVHAYLKSNWYGDRITQLYNKYSSNTVSKYAMKNDMENFAEAFTLYCSGRKPKKGAEPFMQEFEQLMNDAGLSKFKGIMKQSNIRKYRYGK